MMVLNLGYSQYVMETKDALTLLQILEKAEKYQQKYRTGEDSTHHVWMADGAIEAKMISNDLYRMAKLAGKPETD